MSDISLKDVSLNYPVYGSLDRSIKNRLFNVSKNSAINTDLQGNTSIRALTNIAIDIEDGDRIALVGHNGAGKSTLLKLLAKVYKPSTGTLEINGKVSTLFNSSVGLDPASTGYENIILRGLVMGFTKSEITHKMDGIASFCDLGDFLNMPIRTYSEGMKMRLIFSIATSIDPDILLIDEFIGTGDKEFLTAATKRISNLVDGSNILVLASHNLDLLESLCDKAILLDHGQITCHGEITKVLNAYTNS